MDNIIKRLYLSSPSVGLLPFIIFFMMNELFYFKTALVITFLLSSALIFLFNRLVKFHIVNLMLYLTMFILFIDIFFCLIPIEKYFRNYGPFFNEIGITIVFSLVLVKKKKLIKYIYKIFSRSIISDLKLEIFEFFYFLRVCLLWVLVYTLLLAVYLFLFKSYHNPDNHDFFIIELRLIMLSTIIIYGFIRTYFISTKIRQEEWLPIISEDGKVIGKVAKSVSREHKDKFLHPSVRLYVFFKGMLYLNKCTDCSGTYSRKFDTPLKGDIHFDSDIDSTLSLLRENAGIPSRFKSRFIFKHVFEDGFAKRMIFTFVVSLPVEKYFNNKVFSKGKLWTEQEIDNNIGKGVFNKCLEKDYPFLKSIIFPAEKIMSNV